MLTELLKLEPFTVHPGDRREGINTSVTNDVQTVFKGKTYSQLKALYLNIERKIQAGGSNLDIGYWESLLQQVRVYMARARSVSRHSPHCGHFYGPLPTYTCVPVTFSIACWCSG